jgi:CheY-like chemotaxis protein
MFQDMGTPTDVDPLPHPATRRIVLVEDSEDLRGLMRELVAFCGHEVRVASSAREGIELIESCRPHVALIDIGLPDMDGYEVARHLRSGPLAQSVHLVAVTGLSEAQDRAEAFAAGFDEHLVKPVNLAELFALLNEPPQAA